MMDATEIDWFEVRIWRRAMRGLIMEVWHDPVQNAYLWAVGPQHALPMASGRRWNQWDAKEDATNAARNILDPAASSSAGYRGRAFTDDFGEMNV